MPTRDPLGTGLEALQIFEFDRRVGTGGVDALTLCYGCVNHEGHVTQPVTSPTDALMPAPPLSLDLFARAAFDVERTQYEILGGLKRARDAFAQNRIYPHLAHLVRLHRTLRAVLARTSDLRREGNGALQRIDLEAKRLVYAWPDLASDEMAVIEEMIRWALPHIETTIEEGTAVYEFVDERLDVEEVGIVPSYVQEGYLMVPDRETRALHVLRYTISIFADAEEPYRTLRTVHCKTLDLGATGPHPSDVKLRLMQERRDLPNPATYFFDTDVPVPYEDTLLPVVKRRLMRYLHAA